MNELHPQFRSLPTGSSLRRNSRGAGSRGILDGTLGEIGIKMIAPVISRRAEHMGFSMRQQT